MWPLPPDKPRIRYLRSFKRPSHLDRGFFTRVASAVLPKDPRGVIAQPTGLALSLDEKRLYAASSPRGVVVEVNLAKGSMRAVAADGRNAPNAPFDVALDADENLYVSDKGGKAVWVFAKNGKFVAKIGAEVLDNPMSLAVDRKRQLLYVVNGAHSTKTDHRIEVFSLKGKHLRTIGRRGHQPGEFNFPTHLTVAPDGKLWVVDMLNFRVQIFTAEGELASTFGQIGAGQPGAFDKAKGIAFDTFGNVYVVDSMHGVQLFNTKFQPLMWFATGNFMTTPAPIVIDSKNRIYVGDYGQGAIHEFQLINTAKEDSLRAPTPAAAPVRPATVAPAPTSPATGTR